MIDIKIINYLIKLKIKNNQIIFINFEGKDTIFIIYRNIKIFKTLFPVFEYYPVFTMIYLKMRV